MENLLREILKRRKVVGVDISPGSVKVVEFEKKKDFYSLISIGESDLPATAFVAGVIRQKDVVANKLKEALLVKNPKRIKTRFAVVTLPDDQIYTQIINLPKVDRKKIKGALSLQLSSFVPMKEEDIYWTFDILSEDDKNYEIVITAVTKETTDSITETLGLIGLTPLMYESRSRSALRAITGSQIEKDSEFLLIDIGTSVTSISITKKDTIQFSSSFYFGMNQIIKVIGEYKKFNDDQVKEFLLKDGTEQKDPELQIHIDALFETLDTEFKKAINFYGEDKISKVYIYGEAASLQGILEHIQKNTKIKVEQATIDIKVYPVLQWEKHEKISPYIPIIGVELANKIKNIAYINLIPKDQSSKAIRQYFIQYTINALKILLFNFFLLSLLFLVLNYYNMQTINSEKAQIAQYTSYTNNPKYQGVANNINNLNSTLATISKVYQSQNIWSPTLIKLASIVPTGMIISNIKLDNASKTSTPQWQITMSGIALNRKQIILLSSNIQAMTPLFSNIQMPISNFQESVNVPFSIVFNVSPS